MADFLDQKVREIRECVREIEPLVNEYKRLRDTMDALDSASSGAKSSSSAAAAGARKTRRGGPRAAEPTRADKLVELVKDQPGMTVAQAAKAMSVSPNGLYQVVANLSREGRLRKEGSGLFPLRVESSPGGRGETEPQEREVPEAAGDQERREPLLLVVDGRQWTLMAPLGASVNERTSNGPCLLSL